MADEFKDCFISYLETCSSNHSIGLSDGSFTERGLIATTFLDIYHTPNWARLHQARAWSPAVLNDFSIEQYVQMTFESGQFFVRNVAMQGSPLIDWWVTKFRISTSNDGEHFVKNIKVIIGFILNEWVDIWPNDSAWPTRRPEYFPVGPQTFRNSGPSGLWAGEII